MGHEVDIIIIGAGSAVLAFIILVLGVKWLFQYTNWRAEHTRSD